jgi:predicted dithiol-disulfide oxidoreductase (DUF899 family)
MKMNVDVVATDSSAKVVLSEAQKERLGWERLVPVAFELDGERFRATVVHRQGAWCFVANAKMRERGLTPGRRHKIDLVRDHKARLVEPPHELMSLLDTTPRGRERWDALPWHHQREVSEYITEAKKRKTRKRRAEEVVREHLG